MNWLSLNASRPGVDSWLGRRREQQARKGSTFLCGVRVVSGAVAGESRHWRFRQSAADEYVVDGIVTIQHGKTELRLRLVSEAVARGPRPYHLIVETVEVVTGARVELSLPDGELLRFGLD